MARPSKQILNFMTIAAELRAAGYSWDSISPKMGRSTRTCRRWPTLYPDDWDKRFYSATRRLAEEIGSEGRITLKRLLRSKDEKITEGAGKFLSRLLEKAEDAFYRKTDQTNRQTDKDTTKPSILENLDDDQKRALLDEFVVRRMAELRAAQSGGESPASPPVGQ